jgi:hypothetical protein
MKANVLYFPYIRVPSSVWLTRILLYWDQVKTIVPLDFFEDPDALSEPTRSLIQRELVTQVPAGYFIEDIKHFGSSFENYLIGLGHQLDIRRNRFSKGNTFRIHIEKLGSVDHLLKDLKLAKIYDYPWFDVEINTGAEFMAYLAGCLGQHPEVNSDPITDEEGNLYEFLKSQNQSNETIQEINRFRKEFLKRIFPAPNHPLSAEEIEKFKRKHKNILRTFRREVEKTILEVVYLHDPVLREKRIELFQDEIREQVDEIRTKLNEMGFIDIVFGKLCPIIGALPGAHYVFGLVNAIYAAFDRDEEATPVSPLAYAAYADVELLDV